MFFFLHEFLKNDEEGGREEEKDRIGKLKLKL